MKTKFSIILFLLLILTSCGDRSNEGSEKSQNYELSILEDKIFMLDNETAYDKITPQYVEIDGIGYFSFFNRDNRQIYFYNYQSGEIVHKVKLDNAGPNEVIFPYYFFEFWVYDFDNIFINTIQFYYRINKEGEVLKRVKALENFSFNAARLALDESTSFKNGKLYASNNTLVTAEGDTSWLKVIYDFEKGEADKYYLDERIVLPDYEEKAERMREMAKSNGVSSLQFHFEGNYENHYVSSAISDSVYYFQNTELIGSYFAGDPDIASTDLDGFFSKTIVDKSENSISIRPNPTQPAYFSKMLMNPNKEEIYRLLIHGTKPSIDPATDEEQPKVTGVSVVVFNTKTKKSGVTKLPLELLDDLDINFCFATEVGILCPVKEPNSENEKAYKVLKISLIDE
jgi:hypothetical protein